MNFSIYIGRKRRRSAKNGKTVNETQPDRLRLKRDFQNCLLNFPSLNIKKVTDFYEKRSFYITCFVTHSLTH